METRTGPPGSRGPGGPVRITALDGRTLAARLADLLNIAVAAFTAPPWNETRAQASAAAMRLIADSVERAGHLAFMAEAGEEPCGFTYAVLARRLEAMAGHTARPATPFELRELAVDPRYRGLGIGAALHDALITASPATPRYLLTHPGARPALALYRTRGWRSTVLIDRQDIGPRILMHRTH